MNFKNLSNIRQLRPPPSPSESDQEDSEEPYELVNTTKKSINLQKRKSNFKISFKSQ